MKHLRVRAHAGGLAKVNARQRAPARLMAAAAISPLPPKANY